jgi:hypothetical protein
MMYYALAVLVGYGLGRLHVAYLEYKREQRWVEAVLAMVHADEQRRNRPGEWN